MTFLKNFKRLNAPFQVSQLEGKLQLQLYQEGKKICCVCGGGLSDGGQVTFDGRICSYFD